MNIHPKVMASTIVGLSYAIAVILGAIFNIDPNAAATTAVGTLLMSVAGYMKRAPAPPPKIVVVPQAPPTLE